MLAPQRRLRGAGIALGTHAGLHLQDPAMGEEARVVGLLVACAKRGGDAAAWPHRPDAVGRLQQQRIDTLAETDQEDEIARRRLFEHCRQHQHRMTAAGESAQIGHGVGQPVLGDAAERGEAFADRPIRRDDEMADCRARHFACGEQFTHHRGHLGEPAGFAGPTLLERVVEGLTRQAMMVDEIRSEVPCADPSRKTVVRTDDHRRGAMAIGELLLAPGPRQAPIRGGDHDPSVRAAGRALREGLCQRRGSRPLRAADVGREHRVRQVERARDQGRVAAIGEGQGGGGEHQRAHIAARGIVGQGVADRLEPHRQAVLVPVAGGAFAAARLLATVQPTHGACDQLARDAQAGQVDAISCDAGHLVRP